jgi:hypothetical protein
MSFTIELDLDNTSDKNHALSFPSSPQGRLKNSLRLTFITAAA